MTTFAFSSADLAVSYKDTGMTANKFTLSINKIYIVFGNEAKIIHSKIV